MKIEFSINSSYAGTLNYEEYDVETYEDFKAKYKAFYNLCEAERRRVDYESDECFFVDAYQADGDMAVFRKWLVTAEQEVD